MEMQLHRPCHQRVVTVEAHAPSSTAQYLRGDDLDMFNPGSSMRFAPNQDRRTPRVFYKSFDDLGFEGFLWDTDVELVDVPSYGYNVTATPQFNRDRVKFTKKARKNTPDIKLTFRDNAKGYRSGPNLSLIHI